MSYFNKLIIIIISFKEWSSFLKYNLSHCASCWPNIHTVMILCIFYKELWAFIIPCCYSNIVRLIWNIEFSQAPIYKFKILANLIVHNIQRFHISMHNSIRMSIFKSSKKFIHILSTVIFTKFKKNRRRVWICIGNILKNKTWSMASFFYCNIV